MPLRALCLLLLGLFGSLFAGSASAAASVHAKECDRGRVVCQRVSVPLDWSGKRSGKLSISVELQRPRGVSRGVIFLLAGGPGQPSTRYFDIAEYGYWAELFRGYTLVSFDPRGTGDSDGLRCHITSLQPEPSRAAAIVAGCARELGSRRVFFATSDNVRDLDAVRQALGFTRISLYGASYGTYLALAYARTFPARVQRLVLDSVAAQWNTLPVLGEILRAIPSRLNTYCAAVCSGITPNYGREVVTLANALAARPLRGRVVQLNGSTQTRKLDAVRFLDLVVETDLNPGLAAEMPAAVHAAHLGNPVPLLRLAKLVEESTVTGGVATAVYVATSCDDGPFPWRSDTPLGERPALLKAAVAGIPSASFGGFGRWAVDVGNAPFCLGWPAFAPRPQQSAAGYPDVPVLAIGGALDLRTPTSEARALIAHFKHGQLLTVSNAGHAALASSGSPCLVSAVRNWVSGRSVPHNCPNRRLLLPLASFPGAGAQPPAAAAAKLELIGRTLREAADMWLLTRFEGSTRSAPGFQGGRVSDSSNGSGNSGFSLSRYSLVRGLSLSGTVELGISPGAVQLELHGIVRVKSGQETIGTLTVNGSNLDGQLAGRTVTDGRVGTEAPTHVAAAGQGWSAWTPTAGTTSQLTTAIASHVGAEYKLDQAGTPLLNVSDGPPGTKNRLVAVAVQPKAFSTANRTFELTRETWTYTLCGTAAFCSLPGEPSASRGRLVRREALELALYTFRYVPEVSSLLVYLPPAPGEAPSRLLYLKRGQFAAELARPLDKTLTLANPPLPTDANVSETAAIDALTLPHMYDYDVAGVADGGTILRLKPSD